MGPATLRLPGWFGGITRVATPGSQGYGVPWGVSAGLPVYVKPKKALASGFSITARACPSPGGVQKPVGGAQLSPSLCMTVTVSASPLDDSGANPTYPFIEHG